MQLTWVLSAKRFTEATSRALSRRSSSPHTKAPSDNRQYETHAPSEGVSGYSNRKGKHGNNKSILSFFSEYKSWISCRGEKDKSKKEERAKEEHNKEKQVVKQRKSKRIKKEKEKDKNKEHGKHTGKDMDQDSDGEKDKRKNRKALISNRTLRGLHETEFGEKASTRGKSIDDDDDDGDDEVTKQVQDFLQSQQKVRAEEQSSKKTAPQSQDLVGALERAVYKAFVEGRFAHQTLYWPEEDDNKDCRQSQLTESTRVADSDTVFDSNSSMFNKRSACGQRGNSESKDVVSL